MVELVVKVIAKPAVATAETNKETLALGREDGWVGRLLLRRYGHCRD